MATKVLVWIMRIKHQMLGHDIDNNINNLTSISSLKQSIWLEKSKPFLNK